MSLLLHEAAGGARTAIARSRVLTGTAAVTGVAALVLAVVLGDVLVQLDTLRAARALRARYAVAFTSSFTPWLSDDGPSDTAIDDLAAAVGAGDAYTVLLGTLDVDAGEGGAAADGTPVVGVVGDSAALATGGVLPCSPAPCAARGADLADRDVGDVTAAGLTLRATTVMHPGTTVYDPNGGPEAVDAMVLVVLPAASLRDLGSTGRLEAVSLSVWLDPAAGTLDGFVAACHAGGIDLVPTDLAGGALDTAREQVTAAAMYAVGSLAFLVLLVTALSGAVREVLRAEERAWVVRRSCGALPRHVAARVGGFTATVLLALPVPPLLLMTAVIAEYRTAAGTVLTLLAATAVTLWARGTHGVLAGGAVR